MDTTIHLVRHGEVENPAGVIYGHLPGYHLSERGKLQALAASAHLETRDIGIIWASPLERAQETAAKIAEPHGLAIVTDERIVESRTTLEGVGKSIGAFLRSPSHWWKLRNPWGPSWGESFGDIRARMMSAIDEAVASSGGREVVIVSHQTPTQAAKLALEKRNVAPWAGRVRCGTGSVWTLEIADGRVVREEYFEAPVSTDA